MPSLIPFKLALANFFFFHDVHLHFSRFEFYQNWVKNPLSIFCLVVGVCRSQTLDISNLLPNNAGLNDFQNSHGNFFKIFLIFVLRNSNTLYFNVIYFEEIVHLINPNAQGSLISLNFNNLFCQS